MRNTETDRKAFNKDLECKTYKEKIAAWLQDNPKIGELNNGKFYYINPVTRETVYIPALAYTSK